MLECAPPLPLLRTRSAAKSASSCGSKRSLCSCTARSSSSRRKPARSSAEAPLAELVEEEEAAHSAAELDVDDEVDEVSGKSACAGTSSLQMWCPLYSCRQSSRGL